MKNHHSTLSRVFFAFVCIMVVALALPGVGQRTEAQQMPPAPGSPSPGESYAPGQLLLRFRPGVAGQRADEILAQHGLTRMRRVEALQVDVLRLPRGLSVARAVAIYSRHPLVEFAEPNYVLQAQEISDQWGLVKVRAEEAWGVLGTGLPGVLLATVDTGIDRNHSDLYGNIWSNDEIAGNGVDDDGNGYIDDTWGWDFVNNDNDPMDDMMHGTAVSSVSAGVKDGSGVAGVCPNCKLMSVKVLDAMGSGYLDTVAQGIIYAADNGARVINLSLGATTGAATLENAVNEAWGKGALVIAAAGNNGLEQLFYPAAYENAMAVGSTNVEDYRSCFSNYSNDFIDVTAPGEEIVAATPNQSYGTYSGTSLAAPHVTGLAGLLLSKNPGLENWQVWTLIEDSAIDLGPVGKDGYFGAGRVDALRAVSGDTSSTTPPQALYTDDPTATGYAHARKVARDGSGKLHWVWHTQADGLYQVLYATSIDGGQTWTNPPDVVFSSNAETYHPALAVDETRVYVAFPSKHGSATYGVFVRSKPLVGGTWLGPNSPILGGAYDAVRPDLHVDTKTEKIHVVASSLDNAPTVYHTWSNDDGASWQTPSSIPVGFASRYADVYAYDDQITLAVRTVEFWFIFIPRYHLRTFHSIDGGENWQGSNDVATHDGILTGEYGVSLTGLENQLKLAYEHAGNIHFGQSSDGLTWTLLPNPLGAGAWPTLSQSSDGQAWALWDRSSTIVMRHYTGFAWEAEEVLGTGTYPNLKAGISGNLLEWVVSRCSAPYCMTYDSLSLGDNAPPVAGNVNQTITEDPAAPGTWTPVVNDPDGNMLTCSAPPTSAQGGEVTVNSNCSEGTYMPALDFYGTDTFTYQACDPGGLCDSGTVTYDVSAVNDAPLANDVSDTTTEDAVDTWYPNVSEVDGDTLSCTADATSAYGGTVTVAGDCSSGTYDPPPDYHGEDSFNYQACDPDGPCDSGKVSYQVDPVNDPPVASFTVSCSDLGCDFDASGSSDLDGSIESYGWDFGDGSTGTGMTASHTYGAEGTYWVVLTVTDYGGETDTDTQDVTVSRPVTVHVGDLDGSGAVTPGRWEATVTITIQDSHEAAVPPGALVEGSWSNGATGGDLCTTNASGQCSVTKGNLKSNVASVTFSVSSVTSSAGDYKAADNHDPHGDSDGTSITVNKPGVNTPPSVNITLPVDNTEFESGATITFAGTATDAEDGDVTASLVWTSDLDGEIRTGASFSAVLGDGVHTITATATDSAGTSGSASIGIKVGTPPPSVTMHVGDLDGSAMVLPGGKWNATVRIFCEDAGDNQVAGAEISGVWGGGSSGSGQCTTGTNGWCSITLENISKKASFVVFTVMELNLAGYEYYQPANHDPDVPADSNGTNITIQPN